MFKNQKLSNTRNVLYQQYFVLPENIFEKPHEYIIYLFISLMKNEENKIVI